LKLASKLKEQQSKLMKTYAAAAEYAYPSVSLKQSRLKRKTALEKPWLIRFNVRDAEYA
jgi:hypothetical protein